MHEPAGKCDLPRACASDSRGSVDANMVRAFSREPELIAAFLDSRCQSDEQTVRAVWSAASAAAALCGENAPLHYYAGRAARQAGDDRAAEALIERAIRLQPAYTDALVARARLHSRCGEYERARGCLRRVLQAGGDFADVHLMLGDLSRGSGDVATARESYERALRVNPAFAAARNALSELAA